MYAADLVDHVPQKVAALHAVIDAAEHGCDYVAAVVAVGACELAQIGEEPRSFASVGPNSLVLVDESQQLVAGDALRVGGPVAPAVGWLDGRPELLAGECRLLFPLDFQVIQEFQEHDPGQQRQPVEVAVQPLVLAHDVVALTSKGSRAPVRSSALSRWPILLI